MAVPERSKIPVDPIVECHSGSAYAERPTAVTWEGERREVERILARRRTPAGPAFRVLLEDGCILELQYNEVPDVWEVREP